MATQTPQTTNGATLGTKSHEDPDPKMPFQGEQPYGMPDDLVVPKILNLEDTDERLWVL
jgi:hypothetical protein